MPAAAGCYSHGHGTPAAAPTRVGELTEIQLLDLRNNELQGTVPATTGGLVSLRHLDLSGNNFSGELQISHSRATLSKSSQDSPMQGHAAGLYKQSKLLLCHENKHAPRAGKTAAMRSFITLPMTGDSSLGLANLCSATGLRLLNISSNPGLQGSWPDDWGTLSSLLLLEASNTGITGAWATLWQTWRRVWFGVVFEA
jgi:hypothetical protein